MATHLEKAMLAQDADYLRRCSFAVTKYAQYILTEPEASGNHKARYRWASNAIRNSPGVAASISLATTLNVNVDANLGAVSDGDLQTAVEETANLLMFD